MSHVTPNSANESALDERKTRLKMAYTTTSAASTGVFDRVATAMKSIKDSMRRRRVYKQTVSELRALSTRELNDLGISRSMISRIALEASYGK
jgi:uncharacterized protein YjiS (DUF1127 family)